MKRTPVVEKKNRPVRSLRECSRLAVLWHKTNDPVMPLRADVGPDNWQLRLNDFPVEHMYTLLVNGREIDGFDNWPKSWKRPEAVAVLAGTLTERERQILTMLAEGKNARDIAALLALPPGTVAEYRAKLRRKLGATGNADKAKFAAFRDLIVSR